MTPLTPFSPTWKPPWKPWATLTGRTVREDITARIFSRFCVGK
ncbi:MAG: hypothetical protein ACLT1A_11200 [Dysosmobacter sp.]